MKKSKRTNTEVFVFGRWWKCSDRVYLWFRKRLGRWPGKVKIKAEITEIKGERMIGKTFTVHHSRKGKFTMKVIAEDESNVSGLFKTRRRV